MVKWLRYPQEIEHAKYTPFMEWSAHLIQFLLQTQGGSRSDSCRHCLGASACRVILRSGMETEVLGGVEC